MVYGFLKQGSEPQFHVESRTLKARLPYLSFFKNLSPKVIYIIF